MDTAARQMGAFWQLQQIIKDLSGTRVNRNELSPRENELIGAYRGGYQNAEQSYASPPDKAKWYQMHTFYENDDRFREELFKRFLSPALLAEYTKTKADRQATVHANQQGREQAAKAERDQAEAQLQALMKQQQQPEWQRHFARCIASGRSETQCFTEEAKKVLQICCPYSITRHHRLASL